MADYTKIQQAILAENPDVRLLPKSRCWKRTHAHCRPSDPLFGTVCKWKAANSYASTWTLAHEIGHIRTNKSKMTRAESEAAATNWCMDALGRHGLPIKRKTVAKYKVYIDLCHDRALRRGLKRKVKIGLSLPKGDNICRSN